MPEAALDDLVGPIFEEVLFQLVSQQLAEAIAHQIAASVPELLAGPAGLSEDGGLPLDDIEI